MKRLPMKLTILALFSAIFSQPSLSRRPITVELGSTVVPVFWAWFGRTGFPEVEKPSIFAIGFH